MSKSLPKIYSLDPTLLRQDYRILIIGCGGTGGYVTAFLSRIISTINKNVELYIADGDVVEQKNLLRQHFISQDINRNKAVVLAERYSSAFGIPINAIDCEIKDFDIFNTISPNIIIGCVDNNASRKLIHDWGFENSRNLFWVDAGNEEKNGQVVLGFNNSKQYYFNYNYNESSGLFCLPSVFEIYPEMKEDGSQFNSELSCAERSMSSPQNMMTNITAATLVINYVQKILFGEKINSHAVTFTINNVFSTRLNTLDNLLLVDSKRQGYNEKHFFSTQKEKI